MDGIDRHERNRSRFVAEAVVPGTGTPGEGVLYPPLQPGPSGLARPSWALTGQVRSVDERRVDEGLSLFLGLGGAVRRGEAG